MKKILYIVSTLGNTGPTNQLFNLVKYLLQKKFEPYLITLSSESKDSRWSDFSDIGVNLYSLSLSRIQGLIFAEKKLKKLIQEIRPDIIHTQGIRADVLSAKISLNIPKVCTIHNYPQEDYLMTYGKIQGGLMLKKHVDAFKSMDLCVGVSHAVEENIKNNFNVNNTINIPNGVDTDFYSSVTIQEKIKLRLKLGLPQKAKVWISSGSLSRRKDPLFLIEQWQKKFFLSNEHFLLIIGGGPLEKECKILANKSKNIFVAGQVSNVSSYLQASDFYISSSKAEGLPMAVVEALACGLPCFISDIPPHKEIIDLDKSIGNLFKLNNSKSFLANIMFFLDRDYNPMKKASLDLVKYKLSARTMSEVYQTTYLTLLDKK